MIDLMALGLLGMTGFVFWLSVTLTGFCLLFQIFYFFSLEDNEGEVKNKEKTKVIVWGMIIFILGPYTLFALFVIYHSIVVSKKVVNYFDDIPEVFKQMMEDLRKNLRNPD